MCTFTDPGAESSHSHERKTRVSNQEGKRGARILILTPTHPLPNTARGGGYSQPLPERHIIFPQLSFTLL